MKTIRIQITDQERQRLLELRQKSGDYRSERALAVLHCAEYAPSEPHGEEEEGFF